MHATCLKQINSIDLLLLLLSMLSMDTLDGSQQIEICTQATTRLSLPAERQATRCLIQRKSLKQGLRSFVISMTTMCVG